MGRCSKSPRQSGCPCSHAGTGVQGRPAPAGQLHDGTCFCKTVRKALRKTCQHMRNLQLQGLAVLRTNSLSSQTCRATAPACLVTATSGSTALSALVALPTRPFPAGTCPGNPALQSSARCKPVQGTGTADGAPPGAHTAAAPDGGCTAQQIHSRQSSRFGARTECLLPSVP